MSFPKPFVLDDWGKGVIGVFLTCLMIICPIVANWVVAGITMILSLHVLFRAIDGLGSTDSDTAEGEAESDAEAVPAVSGSVVDVEAALAEMADKKAARTVRSSR